jgi:hypothetical protein
VSGAIAIALIDAEARRLSAKQSQLVPVLHMSEGTSPVYMVRDERIELHSLVSLANWAKGTVPCDTLFETLMEHAFSKDACRRMAVDEIIRRTRGASSPELSAAKTLTLNYLKESEATAT